MHLISCGIGLKPHELYQLTMTEVLAYIKGFKAEQKRNAIFFGTIAASIYNVNRSKGSKWYKWSDIFEGVDDEEHGDMTSEEISNMLHGMFGNGVVKNE